MISIIVPVYNAEKQIGNLLNCLLNQTECNLEIILVDDGSEDESGSICDRIQQIDERFRCIHQRNAGVSEARNKGISEAKGEYIAFLDADDEIDLNYFEELLRICKKYEADIAVCDVVVEHCGVELRRFTYQETMLGAREALDELFIRRNINSGPCAKLFKRDVLKGLYFPNLKAYEDIVFIKDSFSRAKTIATTDRTVYHYIQNENGAMSKLFRMPTVDIVIATEMLLEFISENTELSPECFYITLSHLMQYVQYVRQNCKGCANEFISASVKLIAQYRGEIMKCSSFHWKEKIVYIALSFGWFYEDKHFSKLEVS